jgi:hypothetical protein
MKPLYILILFLFSTFYLISTEDKLNIQFTLGILQKNETGIIQSLDFDNVVKVKKNDKFKFYFQPEENTYLYLFYISSEGELTVLFPDAKINDKNIWGFKSEVYIPDNNKWFEFNLKDPDAVDTVYLLASSKQIKELDELINKFSNYNDKSSAGNINEIKDQIIQKVKLEMKENSQFLTYSIKPTPTAGGTRAISLKGNYKQISATNFYAKVFEIKY